MILARLVCFLVVGVGFSSVTVQLLTIREFLSIFQGNEIVIGVILFCWLLLTAMGSFAAKFFTRISYPALAFLSAIIGILPLLQTSAIRLGRDYVFVKGAAAGFYGMLGFVLATITPYCLATGFILPYALIHMKSLRERFSSGHLYLLDSIGDILGGLCFSFIWVFVLTPFQTIAAGSFFCLIAAALLLWTSGHKGLAGLFCALPVLFLMACLNYGIELRSLQIQYTSPIVHYAESRYGRIVVTQDQDQYNFFESGTPLFSNLMTVENEEIAHYPLSQLKKVEKVLLISGGAGGTLKEIQKYKPCRIDYVELDPALIEAAERFHFLAESPNLKLHLTDGRHFVFSTPHRYDAVILDLPEPDTFQMNRFYTKEFYKRVKEVLNPEGVFAFGMSYSPNYLSEIQLQKLSSIRRTLAPFYRYVLLLPGEKAYFLCSDATISVEIPRLLAQKSIATDYISAYYEGNVTLERIEELNHVVETYGRGRINRDFSPVAVKILFTQWFAEHGSSPWYFLGGTIAVFMVYLFFVKRAELALFTTGFAAMGLEMVIIFCFQIMYGYIYLKIGAIVTSFLAGLAPGALVATRVQRSGRGDLVMSEIILIAFVAALAAILHAAHGPLPKWFFLAYGFSFAFFCGYQFPLIARLIGEEASPAAGCLAADLAGAALGTLLTGLVLVPLAGVFVALYFVLSLKIIGLLINMFTSRLHLVYTSYS
jgi:spermidine synthase